MENRETASFSQLFTFIAYKFYIYCIYQGEKTSHDKFKIVKRWMSPFPSTLTLFNLARSVGLPVWEYLRAEISWQAD